MAEHTLYGKRKLCYTEVTDFTDFQGIGRDPLYKRFDSVYSVIEKHIEPQYRDFLAHPIYSDEDQILWYVREWNNPPRTYKDLPSSERNKYAAIKEKTIAIYEKVKNELTGEDKQILAGALKNIEEDFIFCYDDKVVVVAWGMSPDTQKHIVKGAVIHDLKVNNSHKVKFIIGENGTFTDKLAGCVSRPDGFTLSHIDLPAVTPKRGYAFKRWEPNPLGMKVNGPLIFTAIYDEVSIEDEIDTEKVNITFLADDGGSLNGETEFAIDKGTYIDVSQIPIAIPYKGFSFAGWNMQPDKQIIDEDMTFRAIFEKKNVTCRFIAGEHGTLEGKEIFTQPYGSVFNKENTPGVKTKKGYKFKGWNLSPIGYVLNDDTVFEAQYEKVLPWYKRLWALFTGKGCLKWLLWLLLIILAIFLLSLLIKSCEGGSTVRPINKIKTPDNRIIDDNGRIKGITDDDGKLPDENVVAPIVGDDGKEPPIISQPGVPDIVANRLNIYFENADINLEQFVSDLMRIYSEDQCQVIGIDRNVPMLQILIPEDLRNSIRENLNGQLPDYEFFIVDESIFTIVGNFSNDTANAGWHLDAVDAEEGWKITKGEPNIIIAVVDDGIDATHEMFNGKLVNPYNVFTQDNRLSVGQGHGTHVAGLAAGTDKMFDKGVSGIAPKCRLMPVQVFDNGMCTFSSVTSGIMYAIHNDADVINVSIGPNFKELVMLPIQDQIKIAETMFKNEERVWRRIIDVANKHNAVIVFAAGNNHILASIPPENRTNNTINVAAVDIHIKGTDFTNYGKGSNISAPGKAIISSVPVNQYAFLDGTSMAAPIVSGTVALMKSMRPDISVSEILYILQETGEPISNYIPPMVQVDDALIALQTGMISKPSHGNDQGDGGGGNQGGGGSGNQGGGGGGNQGGGGSGNQGGGGSGNQGGGGGGNQGGGGSGNQGGGGSGNQGGGGSGNQGGGGSGNQGDGGSWNQGDGGSGNKGGGGSGNKGDGGSGNKGGGGSGNKGDGGSGNQGSETDYDLIRKTIEFYKRKIGELEKLLPENK